MSILKLRYWLKKKLSILDKITLTVDSLILLTIAAIFAVAVVSFVFTVVIFGGMNAKTVDGPATTKTTGRSLP